MKTNATNKRMKSFAPTILFFVLIFIPILSLAQGGFIPCDKNCGYADLLKLVNNIINWIIMIAVPVAAGVIAWAGLKYMTTGVSDQKAEAKTMINKVVIGLVFILAAWLIVSTIINALLSDEFPRDSIPVQIN